MKSLLRDTLKLKEKIKRPESKSHSAIQAHAHKHILKIAKAKEKNVINSVLFLGARQVQPLPV